MYLESIYLKYFQSWKKAKILFDQGFNAIIGDSDSGKSSIPRAIDWVVNNRPSGEDYKSWFADKNEKTLVTLHFEDDYVTKKREKGKNIYKLADDVTLSAFRSDVPIEVQKICNMEDHNIQGQHEKYFLLQDSPGERARILNKAVGLDVIDELFSFLNNRTLTLSRSIKQTLETKIKIKKELESYSDLDDIEEIIERLKKHSNQFEHNEKLIGKNRDLLKNIGEIRVKIKNGKKRLQIEPKIAVLAAQTHTWDRFQGIILKSRQSLISLHKIRKSRAGGLKNLKANNIKYIELLSRNKRCPTCGSPITKDIIEQIQERL